MFVLYKARSLSYTEFFDTENGFYLHKLYISRKLRHLPIFPHFPMSIDTFLHSGHPFFNITVISVPRLAAPEVEDCFSNLLVSIEVRSTKVQVS